MHAETLRRAALDRSLSLRSRGLIMYLVAKGNSGVPSASTLSEELREGRDAIRAVLAELTEAGYLVRHTYQDSAGHWRKVTWITGTEDGFPGVGGPGHHSAAQPYSHIATSHKSITPNGVIEGARQNVPPREQPQISPGREQQSMVTVRMSEPEPEGLWGVASTPVKKSRSDQRWERPVNTWSTPDLLAEFRSRTRATMSDQNDWIPVKRVLGEFKNLRIAGFGPERLVAAMDIWFADSTNLRDEERPAWLRFSWWVKRHYSKILEATGERRSTYDQMDLDAEHAADVTTERF